MFLDFHMRLHTQSMMRSAMLQGGNNHMCMYLGSRVDMSYNLLRRCRPHPRRTLWGAAEGRSHNPLGRSCRFLHRYSCHRHSRLQVEDRSHNPLGRSCRFLRRYSCHRHSRLQVEDRSHSHLGRSYNPLQYHMRRPHNTDPRAHHITPYKGYAAYP
jgi:hypothetical protein